MSFIQAVTAVVAGNLITLGYLVGTAAAMLRLVGYNFSIAWWISFPISLSTCVTIALVLIVRPRVEAARKQRILEAAGTIRSR